MKKQKKVTAFLASLLLVLSLVMPGNFIQVEAKRANSNYVSRETFKNSRIL